METNPPKLHIIANCASRKRIPPSLELVSIQQSNLEERVANWWEKLVDLSAKKLDDKRGFRHNEKLKAVDLYAGTYWSNIRRLLTEARLAGFKANLWIVSAGYGLISSDEEIHSYSATFTQGDKNYIDNDKNYIGKPIEVLEKWWELISDCSIPESNYPRRLTELINENSNDYFLVIGSSNYLSAIKQDLIKGTYLLSSPENLLIITSKSFSDEILQKNLIAANAKLQCNGNCRENCVNHLIPKGIRGTIGSCLAIKIIERVKQDGFVASKLKQFVENSIEASPALVNFNRVKLADSEVREFIIKELKKTPSASYSSLLRKLRNGNNACEQKRFKDLYWTIRRSGV